MFCMQMTRGSMLTLCGKRCCNELFSEVKVMAAEVIIFGSKEGLYGVMDKTS